MFFELENQKLNEGAKRYFESFEHWARKVIDELAKERYGIHYMKIKDKKDKPYFKMQTMQNNKRVNVLFESLKDLRYPELIKVLFKQPFYKELFAPIFEFGYKGFKPSLIELMYKRLLEPFYKLEKNELVTLRELEQIAGYTGDFIETVRLYYVSRNDYLMNIAASIMSISDSLGVKLNKDDLVAADDYHLYVVENYTDTALYPGDRYTITLDIEERMNASGYDVKWFIKGKQDPKQTGKHFVIDIKESHLDDFLLIECLVVGKQKYHRYGEYDDRLIISINVLPI